MDVVAQGVVVAIQFVFCLCDFLFALVRAHLHLPCCGCSISEHYEWHASSMVGEI